MYKWYYSYVWTLKKITPRLWKLLYIEIVIHCDTRFRLRSCSSLYVKKKLEKKYLYVLTMLIFRNYKHALPSFQNGNWIGLKWLLVLKIRNKNKSRAEISWFWVNMQNFIVQGCFVIEEIAVHL